MTASYNKSVLVDKKSKEITNYQINKFVNYDKKIK